MAINYILCCLALFTAIASAFLDNVTTVILVMPITFAIAKQLEINPVPILITEVFCSNIGGTSTLIGDPPNIIIGTSLGYSFWDFLSNTGMIAAVSLLVMLVYFYLCFRKELKVKEQHQ